MIIIKKYGFVGAAFLIATTMLTGCSDQFLQDKANTASTTSGIYNDYEGSKGRIDDIYNTLLPDGNTDITYQRPSSGKADDHSKSTEEYSGLSRYVDTGIILTTSTNLPSFWGDENKTSTSTYGRIRNCNDAIEGISNGTLTQEQKEKLLGQAYFFRAWAYYMLVKAYGGVPVVTDVANPVAGDDEGESLFTPRYTTKECIDFICSDLSIAAKYLPFEWGDSDYGRVTAGAALALQGRARLLYASPLYNRSDNTQRWEQAYQSNKNAIDTLTRGGFGLAYLSNPGVNGYGWAKMFSDYKSPEAVFVTLYNKIADDGGSTNPYKNNSWENDIRPRNTGGGSGRNATANLVDLFPMADGKKPGASSYAYENNLFMLNRDPRFYRTFAFSGVRWAFSGDPTGKGSDYPYKGMNYELWNYAWYETTEKKESMDQSGFGADGLGTDYRGVYVRKRTDDYDINKSPLYNYLSNESPFKASAAPFMETRYAEVLLNFAEAACGAGHLGEALNALQQVRARVGYTAAENYGLDTDLATNRAKLFAAILYERQVELAYEGKRFDDMRRWLLWDGGVGQESLHSSWKLTGFSGNTCTYLGVESFNGKRRDNLELRVTDNVNGGLANPKRDDDPIKADRPAAWDLANEATISSALENFYRTKLTRKTRQGDEINKTVTFKPQYYIIGFNQTIQKNNKKLEQTIGWEDHNNGNTPGTFDPLAE